MKYKLLHFSLLSMLAILCGGSMFATGHSLTKVNAGQTTVDVNPVVHLWAKVTNDVDEKYLNDVSQQLFGRDAGFPDNYDKVTDREQFTFDATTGKYTLTYTDINVPVDGIGIVWMILKNKGYVPGQGYVDIGKAGVYDITFTYDPTANNPLSAVATKKEIPFPDQLYLFSFVMEPDPSKAPAMTRTDEGFEYTNLVVSEREFFWLLDAPCTWSDYGEHSWAARENESVPLAQGQPVGISKVNGCFCIETQGVYTVKVNKERRTVEIVRTGDINILGYYLKGGVYKYNEADPQNPIRVETSFFGDVNNINDLIEANKMDAPDPSPTSVPYTKTYYNVQLEKGNLFYGVAAKVENGNNIGYLNPDGNYWIKSVEEAGTYNIHFTFTPDTKEITCTLEPVTPGQAWYIIGDNCQWDLTKMEEMRVNPQTGNHELVVSFESGNFYFTVSDVPSARDWLTFNANNRWATAASDMPVDMSDGEPRQLQKQVGTQVIEGAGSYRIVIDPNFGIHVELLKEGSQDAEDSETAWWSNTPIQIRPVNPIKIDKDVLRVFLLDKIKIGDRIRFKTLNVQNGANIKMMTFDGKHQIEGLRQLKRVSAPALHRASDMQNNVEYVLTGDMCTIMKNSGLQVVGDGFDMNAIEIVPTPNSENYTEQSIWIGTEEEDKPKIDPCHFRNFDDFNGVKKGTIIRVTFGETISSSSLQEALKFTVTTSSSPQIMTCNTDFEILVPDASKPGVVDLVIKTDDAATKLNESLGVNLDVNKKVTQVELIAGSSAGINAIKSDIDESKPAYDLSGRRVTKDYKGMVIQNGRKFIK